MMKLYRPHFLIGLVFALTVMLTIWACVSNRNSLAQPTSPDGKPGPPSSIDAVKKKGFEGVDFSYDPFGAPPGQDPVQSAEQVMNKDVAEKPPPTLTP